jgi:hypothetical protein
MDRDGIQSEVLPALLMLACPPSAESYGTPVALELNEEVLLVGATLGAAPLPEHAIAVSTGSQVGVLQVDGSLAWYGGEGELLDATWVGSTLVVATTGGLLAGEAGLETSPLPIAGITRIEGDGDRLFLAAEDGLFRWADDQLDQLTLDGDPLGPGFALSEGIWTVQDGRAVLVGQDLPAQDAELVGPCQVASGSEFARWDGDWSRYTLEHELDWLEGPKNATWGGSGDTLVYLGEPYGTVAAPAGRVSVDALGRLLVSDLDGLRRLSVGYPVGLVGLTDGQTLLSDTTVRIAPTLAEEAIFYSATIDGEGTELGEWEVLIRAADWEQGTVHTLEVTVDYGHTMATTTANFRVEGVGEVTWADHIEPLYSDNCSVCHASSTETILDSAELWEANYDRIWSAVSEERMPLGSDPLTDRQLGLVAGWADGGFQ